MLRSKFTKFLSFLKQQISFTSNFASVFSVMRHKSSLIFQLKFYILSTKGAYQSTNLVTFYVSSRKSKILHFDVFLLSKIIQSFSEKCTEELSLMTLKSDAQFKEKLTSGFKYDMRNFVNFYPTTQKSENLFSMGSLCPKYTRFELQKYRGVNDTEQ